MLRAKERREVTEGLEDIWSVLRHVIDADGRLCLGIVCGMGTDRECEVWTLMDAIATDWDGKGSRCAKAEDLQRDGPSALACCLKCFQCKWVPFCLQWYHGNIEVFNYIPSTNEILLSLLCISIFDST